MTSAAGATYTYNVQGLRTKKTVGNKTTNFTLVGGKVVSDGTSNYFWATELVTNGSVYYLYNAHGDVIQLLNSSGTVTKTYDYDAYGNELTRDQNDPNPFRYCGEYYDTETGFIYLRARYYNPSVGRFISVDPAKDGLNWYSYCENNPVTYVDPWGLKLRDLSPQATVMNYDDVGGAATTSPAKAEAAAAPAKTPSTTLNKSQNNSRGLSKERGNASSGKSNMITLGNEQIEKSVNDEKTNSSLLYAIGSVGPWGKPNTHRVWEETYWKERWFGSDGRAVKDRHWSDHNAPAHHYNPHDQEWDWSDPEHPDLIPNDQPAKNPPSSHPPEGEEEWHQPPPDTTQDDNRASNSEKFSESHPGFWEGVGILILSGAALIWLIANDFTGVGTADDVAIIPAVDAFYYGASIVFG